jgi:hypothetical protein
MATEYLTAEQLEEWTGTPAATFRYWALRGEGPVSVKLGRRRVWEAGSDREVAGQTRLTARRLVITFVPTTGRKTVCPVQWTQVAGSRCAQLRNLGVP